MIELPAYVSPIRLLSFCGTAGTQAAVDRIVASRLLSATTASSASSQLAASTSEEDLKQQPTSTAGNASAASAPASRRLLVRRNDPDSEHRTLRRPDEDILGGSSGRKSTAAAAAAAKPQEDADSSDPKYDPCVEDYAETYLNRADVSDLPSIGYTSAYSMQVLLSLHANAPHCTASVSYSPCRSS